MKMLLLVVTILALASLVLAQDVSQTPYLKLDLPPQGNQNWSPLVNQNFVILDNAVGNLQRSYQGAWNPTTNYTYAQMVLYKGITTSTCSRRIQGSSLTRIPPHGHRLATQKLVCRLRTFSAATLAEDSLTLASIQRLSAQRLLATAAAEELDPARSRRPPPC